MEIALLVSVFVIATCGLVYELISSTLASYLLGDSVTQFSTVIGVYLFSMGIGSYLSKYFNRNLIFVFVRVELLIGFFGGCSAIALFYLFEHVASFRLILYCFITIIGTLVGLEIPLLMRILKNRLEFSDLVSRVFTFDYIGALIASLLFPLVLVPHLGLVQSCFLFGMLNVLVALCTLYVLKEHGRWVGLMKVSSFALLIFMTMCFAYSEKLMGFAEASLYPDEILYSKSSPYQRIVLTKSNHDLRLYLNGNLQFSSRDEYRYHEALIHPGLGSLNSPKNVLILGGGDGLALREVLKYPSIEKVTLVDLDRDVTEIFRHQDLLQSLNHHSFESSKVHLINQDAFIWMRSNKDRFDFIVADFPDPSNYSIGKLYSTTFFRLIRDALQPHGVFVVQCTSPYVARKAFWCIDHTLRAVNLYTSPYHMYVPSFGEWGYIIGTKEPFHLPDHYSVDLKFLNPDTARVMFQFPVDMEPVPTEVNKLVNQCLVRYFEEEWAEYVH